MSAAELGRVAARRMRLVSQGLVDPAPTPAAAVRRLLAVQAQDAVAPLLAIALRTAGTPPRSLIDDAFVTGDLVRTWTMRGTLHAVAAEDVGWLLALTGERTLAASRRIRADLGVTDAVLARSAEVALDALAQTSGTGLRRPDLLAALAEGGVDVSANRGYAVLLALAAQGVLVIGERDGTQYRFHESRERIPRAPAIDRVEAAARLAVRYATGHGPVTERDLAWWAALTLGETRAGIAEAGAALEHVTVDGVPHLVVAGGVPSAAVLERAGRTVLALPAFDELYLGSADRSLLLEPALQPEVTPSSNGRFLPVIVADGTVVATWSTRDAPHVHPLRPMHAALLLESEHSALASAAWLRAGG